MSNPVLQLHCPTVDDFILAQTHFKLLGFDWKAAWKGMLMTFGQDDHWLYLNSDKTFGWDSRHSVNRGLPANRSPHYTDELFKELFPGLVSEYREQVETHSDDPS